MSEDGKSSSRPIQPGFKAQFLEKVWDLEFSELQRPAVLIELGLISIPVLATVFGSRLVLMKSRKQWMQRKFSTTLNISINTITKTSPGHYDLKIRTIAEAQLSSIIANPEGLRQIELASERTTPDDVILPLTPPTHWICYNQVLNHVASMSRDGFLMRDVCGPQAVDSDWYVIALTCEPNVIQKKIRALMIKRSDLLDMANSIDEIDSVEICYHVDRIIALRQMAIRYKKQLEEHSPPEPGEPRPDATRQTWLPRVEICVPKGKIEVEEKPLDL